MGKGKFSSPTPRPTTITPEHRTNLESITRQIPDRLQGGSRRGFSGIGQPPAPAPAQEQPVQEAPAPAPVQTGPSIGPNQSRDRNGLPTLEDMASFAGISPKELASIRHGSIRLMKLNSALKAFHTAMEQPIPIQTRMNSYQLNQQQERKNYFGADPAHFERLIDALTKVIGATEAMLHKPSKGVTPLLGGLGNLLNRAHLLLPSLVALPNVYAAYVLETGQNSATGSELYASHFGKTLGGSMATTQLESQSAAANKVDLTAARNATEEGSSVGATLLDQSMSNRERGGQLEREIQNRHIPAANSKHLDRELLSIMKMIDDLELRTDLGFTDRLYIRNKYSPLMAAFTRFLAARNQANAKDAPILTDRDRKNQALAVENMSVMFGKSVGDALVCLDSLMMSRAENDVVPGGQKKGGMESDVFVDAANSRILRINKTGALNQTKAEDKSKTSAVQKMDLLSFQREVSYTPTIDEALSVVGKALGFRNVAESSAKYFKTADGTLNYGSDMALAKGSEARTIAFDGGYTAANGSSPFKNVQTDENGNTTVEGNTKSKRLTKVNFFDHQNANSIAIHEGLMQLQVVDFITGHRDRHTGNFFINANAVTADEAVTGIDNDVAFGLQPGQRGQNAMNVLSYREDEGDAFRQKADQVSAQDFKYVTRAVHDKVMALDVDALDRALRPFVSQVARTAAIGRAKKLKDIMATANIIDLTTDTGMQALREESELAMISSFLRQFVVRFKNKDKILSVAMGTTYRDVGNYHSKLMLQNFEGISGAIKSYDAGKDIAIQILAKLEASGLSRDAIWAHSFNQEELSSEENQYVRSLFLTYGFDQKNLSLS